MDTINLSPKAYANTLRALASFWTGKAPECERSLGAHFSGVTFSLTGSAKPDPIAHIVDLMAE